MKTKINTATVYETGADTWKHGDRVSLHDCFPGRLWVPQPFGRCLGPCATCGSRTVDYGGGWACISPNCPSGIENKGQHETPPWWNCHINVYRDGDAWCAVGPGFMNLQESPAGFGRSPGEAVSVLCKNIDLASLHADTMSALS